MTKSKAPSKPMSKAERVARANKFLKSAGTRVDTITTQRDDACRDYGIASREVANVKHLLDMAKKNLNDWICELRIAQQPERVERVRVQEKAEVPPEVVARRLAALDTETISRTINPDSNVYLVNTAVDTDHHTCNKFYA